MLPGLKPHWEDMEIGQEPWLHLSKLSMTGFPSQGKGERVWLHVKPGLKLPVSCVTMGKPPDLSDPPLLHL